MTAPAVCLPVLAESEAPDEGPSFQGRVPRLYQIVQEVFDH